MSKMKEVREMIGCNQTKMAKIIGTWPNRISEIENPGSPRKETKQMLAQLEAIKLVYFLGGINTLFDLLKKKK